MQQTNFTAIGECSLNSGGTVHTIAHRDIEFLQEDWFWKKTVIHLKNGESLTVDKDIKQVTRQLDKKCFGRCGMDRIVNTLNIYITHQVGRKDYILEFVSGAKTFLSGEYYIKKFAKTYKLRVACQTHLRLYDIP